MTQPELCTFPSAETFRQVARQQFVLRRAAVNAIKFRDDFPAWLEKNLGIWERFEAEANRIYARGRHHYSARTIGEFIRHETALAAEGDGEWKINNNRFPDLARLYLMLYPERGGFFDLRDGEARAA